MNLRWRPVLAVLVVLASTAAATAVASPTLASVVADADGPVPLPLGYVSDMVVDDAHGHLFFASGFVGNGILVTDFAGQVVTTIPQQEGANGLALSPDGTRLYAALYGGHAVSEIDTATLTETRRFATGPDKCPAYVAADQTRVWFTYTCGYVDGLGSVDVAAAEPVMRTDYVPDRLAIQLVSVGGTRLALGDSQGDGDLRTYEIGDGQVTQLASLNPTGVYDDLQITPDGMQVLTAGGGSSIGSQAWQTADLSPAETYPTGYYAAASALSGDGSLLAAGASSSSDGPDVWVFRRGDTTPLRTVDFGQDPNRNPYRLISRQLAFSGDATRLFAVTHTKPYDPYDPALWVIHDPTKRDSRVTVDVPATAGRGEQITVTGQLTFNDAVSTPYTLQVERTDRAGTHALPEVTTAPDGAYSFTDTPPEGGPSTYTVTFAGDETALSASASDTVKLPIVAWDVDGDDVADLVAGVPGRDVGKAKIANAGAVALLDSDPSGVTGAGARLLTQNSVRMPDTAEVGDRLGSPSASGDFNADGFADVVVSAPREDYQSSPDTGLVHILYGSPTGLTMAGADVIDASDVGTGGTNYRLGAGLAVGDFEGDGYDDLAIGAPKAGGGVVYLRSGSASGLGPAYWTRPLSQSEPGLSNWSNNTPGDDLGSALAAGDTNGDGRDDLAIGVPGDPERGGGVYVLYGDPQYGIIPPGARMWSKGRDGVPGYHAAYGSDKPDSFGEHLAFGDYNGDGMDDLAVAAPGSPVSTTNGDREDAGTVNILPGSTDGVTPGYMLTQQSAGVPDFAEVGDLFGSALEAGDTNGDGADELAITSAGDHTVTVLVGSSGQLGSSQADQRWIQGTNGLPNTDEAEDRFGASLRIAPFNGAGAASLAITVPGENAGTGRVQLLYSTGSTGLVANGAQSISLDTTGVPGTSAPGDQFGSFS